MDFPAVEMSSALAPRWGATPTRRSGFSAPHGSIRSHVTCRCSHGPSDGAPDAPRGGEKSAGKALLRIAVGAATIAAPWVSPFVASTVQPTGVGTRGDDVEDHEKPARHRTRRAPVNHRP